MMASCHSNRLAESITDRLTMDDVARRYGFEPTRSGFIRCPFHKGDKTASLKLYPGNRGWCCFGCHKGGTVINFVMELFGINFKQAVLRINTDFGLGLNVGGPVDLAEESKYLQQRQAEQRELDAYREEYHKRCVLHRAYWEALKQGETAPLYCEALRNIDALDNWFDEHPWR